MPIASPHIGLIQHLAEALVDDPISVAVREVDGHPSPIIELRVGAGDLGKVIGRRGQTARAIRVLLAAACQRTGRRAVLNIVEE
jgi:uncharacterized protein